MITQEISHIFRVRQRWNRQNRSILTILNLRLTFLRFHEKGVSRSILYIFFTKIAECRDALFGQTSMLACYCSDQDFCNSGIKIGKNTWIVLLASSWLTRTLF